MCYNIHLFLGEMQGRGLAEKAHECKWRRLLQVFSLAREAGETFLAPGDRREPGGLGSLQISRGSPRQRRETPSAAASFVGAIRSLAQILLVETLNFVL